MSEKIKNKSAKKSVKKSKEKLSKTNELSVQPDCPFVLIKNDGLLPLIQSANIALIECKKSNSASSEVPDNKSNSASSEVPENKSNSASSENPDNKLLVLKSGQFVKISYFLGQKNAKSGIKATVNLIKKYEVVVLLIENDIKSEVAELEQLALSIKKQSQLILCYHNTSSLLSSSLIDCARCAIISLNSKANLTKISELLFGSISPYERINLSVQPPFVYENLNTDAISDDKIMGFGLSYVNTSFTNLNLSHYNAKVGEVIRVSVVITNNSSYDVCEIPQLYVIDLKNTRSNLISYQKVTISSNESVTVNFFIDTGALSFSPNDDESQTLYVGVGKSSLDLIKIPIKLFF